MVGGLWKKLGYSQGEGSRSCTWVVGREGKQTSSSSRIPICKRLIPDSLMFFQIPNLRHRSGVPPLKLCFSCSVQTP